jgi:hypothetical protein
MDDLAEYASFVIFILIYLVIFIFCAIKIKRRLFDNKQIGSGFHSVGRSIFTQYQNAERQEAVEEIIFEEEEGRDEALSGEGFGLDKKNGLDQSEHDDD